MLHKTVKVISKTKTSISQHFQIKVTGKSKMLWDQQFIPFDFGDPEFIFSFLSSRMFQMYWQYQLVLLFQTGSFGGNATHLLDLREEVILMIRPQAKFV